MFRIFNFILVVFVLISSCAPSASDGGMSQSKKEEKTTAVYRYWVASERVACEDSGPQTCYLVQRGDTLTSSGWELFYDEIQGFDYEPGQLYHIRVRETKLDPSQVAQDASTTSYEFVELIGRTPDLRLQVHNIYTLTEIEGEKITVAAGLARPSLEINLTTNQVMGNDGCNQFSGTVQVDYSSGITFGPLAGTKKMCPAMDLPNRYRSLLEKVARFTFIKGDLVLQDLSDNALLKLRNVD